MTSQRQLKPDERMLLLILLNEKRPVSIHKLAQIAGTNTKKTIQTLYVLTENLRIVLTINQEAEIAVSERSSPKLENANKNQHNLF